MDPDRREEVEVFSDPEEPNSLRGGEEEQEEQEEEPNSLRVGEEEQEEEPNSLRGGEEEQEEEQEEEEEEEGKEGDEEDEEEKDAKIFNAWMGQYRAGERQRRGEEEEEGEAEGGRAASRSSFEPPVRIRTDRRASLPCPSTLSAMQLLRLHSSTKAPVTARVLLRRTSSRRLLPAPQEAGPAPERRSSLIPPIPEATGTERKSHFRRRNVMSLSDADSVCLICHNDLSKGGSGIRELQCTHTFHRECIEEWLWRKQSCPTCRVQVSMPQPLYWGSTRVKVP